MVGRLFDKFVGQGRQVFMLVDLFSGWLERKIGQSVGWLVDCPVECSFFFVCKSVCQPVCNDSLRKAEKLHFHVLIEAIFILL